MTVDRHANTSAASVPLALDEAVCDGRVCSGDLVVLEAMGGGFIWAPPWFECRGGGRSRHDGTKRHL